jgi:quercetin dioxygenase-like cupin family protein
MEGIGSPRARIVLSPDEGEKVMMGGLGVRFMIEGAETGGNFALVEHPIGPRVLAAPLHTHEREDEYTYVLEGEVGVQVGDEILIARPGDLILKPRGVPHAFWNAGDAPARALEIISPPASSGTSRRSLRSSPPNHTGPPDEEALGAVMAKYRLDMDFASIPLLVERHGLATGEPPA